MVFVIVCVCDCVFLSLCSSYLHCRWADLEELEKDKRIHQKVKRFRAKQAIATFVTEVSPAPLSSPLFGCHFVSVLTRVVPSVSTSEDSIT